MRPTSADEQARFMLQIERRPNDPAPRWQMGRVAWAIDNIELARQGFQVALALDPSFEPTQRDLAILQTSPGHAPPSLAFDPLTEARSAARVMQPEQPGSDRGYSNKQSYHIKC